MKPAFLYELKFILTTLVINCIYWLFDEQPYAIIKRRNLDRKHIHLYLDLEIYLVIVVMIYHFHLACRVELATIIEIS